MRDAAATPSGCHQFSFPDVEAKIEAVFDKNLAFALNVARLAA